MREELQELWRFRELLFTLVVRDIKGRYKGSVIGFFWSFLTPLSTVFVMTFAFRFIMGVTTKNFTAYLFAGILSYTFFQQSILDASQSIVINAGLVKKVYFPREVLPLAIIISNLVHFILGLVVFFVYLLGVWTFDPRFVPFQASSLLVPLLIIPHFLFTAGVGLFFCALNTFYEDVKYILGIVLFLFFYLSPVIYNIERILESEKLPKPITLLLYKLTYLNPNSAFLVGYKKLLLAPSSQADLPLNWGYILVATAISVIVFMLGYAKFNKDKWKFAER